MPGSRVTFTGGRESRSVRGRAQPWGMLGPFLALPSSPILAGTLPEFLPRCPESQAAASVLGLSRDFTAAPSCHSLEGCCSGCPSAFSPTPIIRDGAGEDAQMEASALVAVWEIPAPTPPQQGRRRGQHTDKKSDSGRSQRHQLERPLPIQPWREGTTPTTSGRSLATCPAPNPAAPSAYRAPQESLQLPLPYF